MDLEAASLLELSYDREVCNRSVTDFASRGCHVRFPALKVASRLSRSVSVLGDKLLFLDLLFVAMGPQPCR